MTKYTPLVWVSYSSSYAFWVVFDPADINHTPTAKAVLTLGKDMTFRDYAQGIESFYCICSVFNDCTGAFRMRGIAKGQTIQLFIIPEVKQLVSQFSNARFGAVSDSQLLAGVSAWLVVNAMKSETTQSNIHE